MAFYTEFAGYYDRIFPVREASVAFLQRWLPPCGAVLDIGCGTGGHLARVVRAGRPGLGLDPDEGMIDEAMQRHPQVGFLPWGMEQISRLPPAAYGAALCLGNVLPHLPGEALPAFLHQVWRRLVPGGVWIFQTVNFAPVLSHAEFALPDIAVDGGGLRFQRRYLGIRRDRLRFHTALTGPGGDVFRGETTLYPRTAESYRRLHEPAAWRELGHFADWAQSAFDPRRSAGSLFVWRKVAAAAPSAG